MSLVLSPEVPLELLGKVTAFIDLLCELQRGAERERGNGRGGLSCGMMTAAAVQPPSLVYACYLSCLCFLSFKGIVTSSAEHNALDLDSVLWREDRQPLGRVRPGCSRTRQRVLRL